MANEKLKQAIGNLAVQIQCAIGHSKCYSGPLDDWFRIVLCDDVTVMNFCPRHALAAEALAAMGLSGAQIVSRLQQHENHEAIDVRPSLPA